MRERFAAFFVIAERDIPKFDRLFPAVCIRYLARKHLRSVLAAVLHIALHLQHRGNAVTAGHGARHLNNQIGELD